MQHCHFWIAIAGCDRLATDNGSSSSSFSPSTCFSFPPHSHIHIHKSNNDNEMQETCMDSLMGLQVRALGVHLAAAGEIAVVDSPLLQFRVVASIILYCSYCHWLNFIFAFSPLRIKLFLRYISQSEEIKNRRYKYKDLIYLKFVKILFEEISESWRNCWNPPPPLSFQTVWKAWRARFRTFPHNWLRTEGRSPQKSSRMDIELTKD